jgi:CopG family transcriptional regulator, nickel-responsive regulator
MKKPLLSRFSVSMSRVMAGQLDALAKPKGYTNRTRAVADMFRAHLLEHRAQAGAHEIAGTVTLVYDHHRRNIQALLTGLQHDHGDLIVATLHVHLSHHECMEVLAVRGPAGAVKHLADRLTAAKGVMHGKLTVTTTGRERAK